MVNKILIWFWIFLKFFYQLGGLLGLGEDGGAQENGVPLLVVFVFRAPRMLLFDGGVYS